MAENVQYLTAPERYMEMAKACCARDDWEKAIENYCEAIELMLPDDEMVGDAEIGIAYCLLNQGKRRESADYHALGAAKFACKEKGRLLTKAYFDEISKRFEKKGLKFRSRPRDFK